MVNFYAFLLPIIATLSIYIILFTLLRINIFIFNMLYCSNKLWLHIIPVGVTLDLYCYFLWYHVRGSRTSCWRWCGTMCVMVWRICCRWRLTFTGDKFLRPITYFQFRVKFKSFVALHQQWFLSIALIKGWAIVWIRQEHNMSISTGTFRWWSSWSKRHHSGKCKHKYC